MKRSVRILFTLSVSIVLFTLLPSVQAQGTCTCIVGESRTCGLNANHCDSGYQPECATITLCNASPTSCTCVLTTPGNCLSAGTPCSYPNTRACCSPYSCNVGYCTVATPTPAPPGPAADLNPCQYVDSAHQGQCKACAGIWSALGCIPISQSDPAGLIRVLLQIGLGLAGGIAFLLILFGGLQIMTSAGNPEQLNAGRELVSSAVIGLVLVLFSVFLLQFIGVSIIGIPGFTP